MLQLEAGMLQLEAGMLQLSETPFINPPISVALSAVPNTGVLAAAGKQARGDLHGSYKFGGFGRRTVAGGRKLVEIHTVVILLRILVIVFALVCDSTIISIFILLCTYSNIDLSLNSLV